jgi:hypothetical protein
MNSHAEIEWPSGAGASGGAAHGPAICCEILPVTLAGAQIAYLRRHKDGASGIWQLPLVGAHPSELVRAECEAFLARPLDPRRSVVHSTAWRYECGGAGGRLILTYLAALAPGDIPLGAGLMRQICLEPITAAQPARSETLMPPAQIGLAHVLAHALDHLALLLATDAAIEAALGEAWRMALQRRMPRPAGELHPARGALPIVA